MLNITDLILYFVLHRNVFPRCQENPLVHFAIFSEQNMHWNNAAEVENIDVVLDSHLPTNRPNQTRHWFYSTFSLSLQNTLCCNSITKCQTTKVRHPCSTDDKETCQGTQYLASFYFLEGWRLAYNHQSRPIHHLCRTVRWRGSLTSTDVDIDEKTVS